jgi:hypothetical protein
VLEREVEPDDAGPVAPVVRLTSVTVPGLTLLTLLTLDCSTSSSARETSPRTELKWLQLARRLLVAPLPPRECGPLWSGGDHGTAMSGWTLMRFVPPLLGRTPSGCG